MPSNITTRTIVPTLKAPSGASQPSAEVEAIFLSGTRLQCANVAPPNPIQNGVFEPLQKPATSIKTQSLVPVTVGEIGVSWAGSSEVSRGYMDLPEKTAERFRFDPYSQDGTKMYDTGDLCQWNPSGTIPFLGPVNDQVKAKV
ncbi:hypothetical protein LZL87_012825 [Fusarium oxysporum]|nr:hypothetical protein LZL87_012825 [Fusarium oxysporum]